LRALAPTAIPAPALIAVDPDGAAAGVPALLTGRLPGRPPSIGAVGRGAVLTALGEALVAIHQVGPTLAGDVELRRQLPTYGPFGDLADARVPPMTRRPDRWTAALDIAATPPTNDGPATLLHRDYHAWNTLWIGDRLTGVVDWTSASWGPPAADLAHLRVDLAVHRSVAAAVEAREAFRLAGGDLTNARHHQLRTVFDYLGDAGDLADHAVARLDDFLGIVLEEADER
jgi:aminoglycoside phosphotransferase (APT) family kinase protein